MVRTVPFHGINTGSSPVRDIFFNLKMFFQFISKPLYVKYWKQILIKTYYNIFIFINIWIISIYNIDSILYFFAKDLLSNMDTPKFFFTNILEIFWMYLEISLYVSFFWSLPFFIINYLVFF